MKTRIITIVLISLFVFSGKKIPSEIKDNGVILSYATSINKAIVFKTSANRILEYYAKDITQSSKEQTESTDTFTVLNADTSGNIEINIKFGDRIATTIEGGDIKAKDDEDLNGETITLKLDSEGQIIDWTGLNSLGYNSAGMDEGELIANNIAQFSVIHLPKDIVKIGSTWTRKFTTKQDTKKGSINQNIEKIYTLKSFDVKDDHLCAKINVEIKLTVTGEGEESQEGQNFKFSTNGKGSGKGEVLFDFENGYVYKSTMNWLLDFKMNIETDTGEKESISYYDETKETRTLQSIK